MSHLAEKKSTENTERSEPQAASIVTYTEEEMEAFKNNMELEAKNTNKLPKTPTAVRRLHCWN